MYCNDCGRFFDEPDKYTTSEYHFEVSEMGNTPKETFTELACPYCGSGDIDDSTLCIRCGSPAVGLLCDVCLDDIRHDLKEFAPKLTKYDLLDLAEEVEQIW